MSQGLSFEAVRAFLNEGIWKFPLRFSRIFAFEWNSLILFKLKICNAESKNLDKLWLHLANNIDNFTLTEALFWNCNDKLSFSK